MSSIDPNAREDIAEIREWQAEVERRLDKMEANQERLALAIVRKFPVCRTCADCVRPEAPRFATVAVVRVYNDPVLRPCPSVAEYLCGDCAEASTWRDYPGDSGYTYRKDAVAHVKDADALNALLEDG